jgi:hypothetical protein
MLVDGVDVNSFKKKDIIACASDNYNYVLVWCGQLIWWDRIVMEIENLRY